MKLTFTQKLILDSAGREDAVRTLQYVSYLKEDYIERLLRLTVEDDRLSTIYFSSNDFGTATWVRGAGIVESHRWETEDDLRDVSYLARHYPAPIEDGHVSDDYALKNIVPDVLGALIDPELARAVERLVANPADESALDWEAVVDRGKRLSADFVEGLITRYEAELRDGGAMPGDGPVPGTPSPTAATRVPATPGTVGSLFSRIKSFLFFNPADHGDAAGAAPGGDGGTRELQGSLERARRLARKIKRL